MIGLKISFCRSSPHTRCMSADQSAPLTEADAANISGAARELVSVVQGLTRAAIGPAGPTEGTVAAAQLASPIDRQNSDGTSRMYSAHMSIFYSNLAALDHMSTFIQAVRVKSHGVSLATLCRGAIESFGRSFYLLTATTPIDLLYRHASLINQDVGRWLQYNSYVRTDGSAFDMHAHLDELREMLVELKLPVFDRAASPTALATAVLDAASEQNLGRSAYSQLSAVAHGASTAVVPFLAVDGVAVSIQIPRAVAFEYTGMIVGTCAVVTEELIARFGLSIQHRERWHAAQVRSSAAFDKLHHS